MTPFLTCRVLFVVLPLAGCALPQPTPPPRPSAARMQAQAAPSPVLGSLAAFAVVRFVDPSSGQAVLETPGGAVMDMTAAPGARNLGALRQGARVVVEYDASGAVRIAPAARLDRGAAGGRMRATVREVAVGGGTMVLAGLAGGEQEVTLRNPPMMAFATRLRAGDEVAVTLPGEAAP